MDDIKSSLGTTIAVMLSVLSCLHFFLNCYLSVKVDRCIVVLREICVHLDPVSLAAITLTFRH